MKKFNKMTEKQMVNVNGGFAAFAVFLISLISCTATGAIVGTGVGVGLRGK